jgi:ADP-heptose:LPS heptosyltransferase
MLRQMLDLLELAAGRQFATPTAIPLAVPPALAERAARTLPSGPVYVGLAPGAGGRPKCWPLERFVAVARVQGAAGRVPVFVLGPRESDWRAALATEVPGARFPLQEWDGHGYAPHFTVALAGRLACAVSNDSGTGHMFALGGAPLVALYGPTVPEKFLPMTPRLAVLRARDFGGPEIERIPERAVIEALRAMLDASPDHLRAKTTQASAIATNPSKNE